VISAGKHQVQYEGPTAKDDAWLSLGASRFQWLTPPRHGAGANPTFGVLPAKDGLVDARVKVFWPGMGR